MVITLFGFASSAADTLVTGVGFKPHFIALIGGELARGGRIEVRLDGDKLAFSPVEEEAASTQPG